MKKLFFTMLFILAGMAVNAQAPAFKWVKTSHDFGTFREGDVKTVEFTFTNIGDKPLIIYKASASCGCTTAEWPKAPIKPGQTGTIKVTYDSKDKPYPFQKSIWIMSNVPSKDKANANVELKIKGVVQ